MQKEHKKQYFKIKYTSNILNIGCQDTYKKNPRKKPHAILLTK